MTVDSSDKIRLFREQTFTLTSASNFLNGMTTMTIGIMAPVFLQIVGGVNATSLALVMIAPILWMVHATFVARECSLRQALAAGLRLWSARPLAKGSAVARVADFLAG